jgi:hypothetical protein
LDKKRYYFATKLKDENEKDSVSLIDEHLDTDGLPARQSLWPGRKQHADSDESGLRQNRGRKSLPDKR